MTYSMNKKNITILIIMTAISMTGYLLISSHANIASKASILESAQKIQGDTGIMSAGMTASWAIKQSEPKWLGSAPPVEVYFLESQFWVYDASGCGDGTYQSPETPCRTVPEKLTKAVSTALETFHRVVGEDFNEDEFFKIFMIDEVTGQFKETLDWNLHLTPDDPIGSGERLAKAYTDAEKLRKR